MITERFLGLYLPLLQQPEQATLSLITPLENGKKNGLDI